MAETFDFISAAEKPALLAFSTPEWHDIARQALEELGYKTHNAATPGDFLTRFNRLNYEVVILEELFCAGNLAENATLHELQQMSMNRRRHTTIILVGDSFQTFNPMHAFQQSVHATVGSSEISLLKQLIEKTVSDNQQFLSHLREAQARIFAGKTRDSAK